MGDYVNSTQIRFDRSHVSCGVLEAHHLPDVSGTKLAFAIATALYHKANPRPTAFVIFSDTVESGRGRRLAEFLIGKKFEMQYGVVHKFGPEINPKTGNSIEFWVWCPKHETVRAWYQDEHANRLEDTQG